MNHHRLDRNVWTIIKGVSTMIEFHMMSVAFGFFLGIIAVITITVVWFVANV